MFEKSPYPTASIHLVTPTPPPPPPTGQTKHAKRKLFANPTLCKYPRTHIPCKKIHLAPTQKKNGACDVREAKIGVEEGKNTSFYHKSLTGINSNRNIKLPFMLMYVEGCQSCTLRGSVILASNYSGKLLPFTLKISSDWVLF